MRLFATKLYQFIREGAVGIIPTHLAIVFDKTERTFRNFGIYVIEARGERIVKRVQRKFDGSLILISDNAKYQPETIPAELAKEVNVVGRVVWRGGRI